MKIGELLKKAAAAVFTAPAPAPIPPPAPRPGIHFRPGKHTIRDAADEAAGRPGSTIEITGEPDALIWHPLPRYGRYVIDSKIFYATDPRAGYRIIT